MSFTLHIRFYLHFPHTLPSPPSQKAKSTSTSPHSTRTPSTTMKSTKTSISAPSLAATSTAEAPPRAAAPAFTMSRADACRKQQICRRLDNICIKVIFRSRAFTDVSHKFSRMCFKKKYKPYVDFDPEVNLAMLTITCEHEREKLEEVVKMQLEVARQARLLCSAEAKEKRLDAAYWKLVNKYKKG